MEHTGVENKGGFIGFPVEEEVIKTKIVGDIGVEELIVFFEKSTWKLVYTANEHTSVENKPFKWKKHKKFRHRHQHKGEK